LDIVPIAVLLLDGVVQLKTIVRLLIVNSITVLFAMPTTSPRGPPPPRSPDHNLVQFHMEELEFTIV
jgi:hypothetical protein